jgi:Leucine-rich repeat (LRR) protein
VSVGGAQCGLQELIPDISKLVNLKILDLGGQNIPYIAESISCLKTLEHLGIFCSESNELPAGLGMLENLVTLHVSFDRALRIVPNLEVIHLECPDRLTVI